MAIIRNGSRVRKTSTHSCSSTDDDVLMKQATISAEAMDSEASGDSKYSDGEIEICQVGEEMCAVPQELFELSDLKEILSMDSWNYFLTEKERESLCAYLPNMDEAAYRQTLKELFAGENFFFGSPLTQLLERMKGGLCHPHVVPYREGLRYLQRKEYYHNLRKYHNGMVNYFLEMQHLWQSYPYAGVEERIELWNSQKFQKAKRMPTLLPRMKINSLRRRRCLRQSNKLLKVKEAPEKLSPPPEIDTLSEIKESRKTKLVSKLKQDVKNGSKQLEGEVTERLKSRGKPRGMAKARHKGPLNAQITPDIEKTEATPPLEEKSMPTRPGLDCVLENESAVIDKPFAWKEGENTNGVLTIDKQAVKKKVEKRVKGLGTGRKRKRVNEVNESEAHCVKNDQILLTDSQDDQVPLPLEEKLMQESNEQEDRQVVDEQMREESVVLAESRKDEEPKKYRRRGKVKEKSINEEFQTATEKHMEDTRVQEEAQDIGEHKPQEPVTFEESKKDGESMKKYRRRVKVKEKRTNQEVDTVTAINKEPIEDALVQDEKEKVSIEDNIKDLAMDEELGNGKPPKKWGKKKLRGEENVSQSSNSSPDGVSVCEKKNSVKVPKKLTTLIVPAVVLSCPFSVIHLLSAVRAAMLLPIDEQASELIISEGERGVKENLIQDRSFVVSPDVHYCEPNGQPLQFDDALDIRDSEEQKVARFPSVPFHEIVSRVQTNPGDPRILEMQEPLQGLVRGVLKVLSLKTSPLGVKGWKPFVAYDKETRSWMWIGPSPPSPFIYDAKEVQILADAWGVSQKTLIKIQEVFADWLKHAQETLRQLGQLSLSPPPPMPVPLDEKERFRELRAQRSLITITPSSEEMRAYFRREEVLRYSVPDRAFTYTTADGQKTVVAALRRIGGKPNSKVRDHFMLKSDRPPHVTILCLVRDAAARLPGGIGTRADVCALIRDSQYIADDVSDVQLNQVVSGALDRLHYERDPCVRFDGDRKLWVYLHRDRDEEDFEDDGTSSTKRWKKSKKDGVESLDSVLAQDYSYSGRDDPDLCGMGLDFGSPSCFGGPGDLSVYSADRPELVYNYQNGTLNSPHVLGSEFPGQMREDGLLPFIDLPPSIQPPCVHLQQSHPMGWEVFGNRWDQESCFRPNNHIVQEDYNVIAVAAAMHGERGLH